MLRVERKTRPERRTSNLPFNEWTEAFGSARPTGDLPDRLTHHVHILEMSEESYRPKDSKRRHPAKPLLVTGWFTAPICRVGFRSVNPSMQNFSCLLSGLLSLRPSGLVFLRP